MAVVFRFAEPDNPLGAIVFMDNPYSQGNFQLFSSLKTQS
jgi:hypothetical protein